LKLNIKWGIGNAISVTDPGGIKALTFSRQLTNGSYPLPPGIFVVLISVIGLVDPKAIVQLEGLSQLKKMQCPHQELNPNSPACSIKWRKTLNQEHQMLSFTVCFFCSSDNMEEMQCQLQISRDTLLMGGHQDKLIEFNLNQGQETNLVCISLYLVFSFCYLCR
jgi:hypothetical protein